MARFDGSKNLVKIDSTEKARALGALGGKASGVAKRQKKLLKDTINEFLETTNPATGNTFQIDLVNSMLNKAIIEGDVSAFNTLRDTSGQKPKEEIQAVVMPMINIKGL